MIRAPLVAAAATASLLLLLLLGPDAASAHTAERAQGVVAGSLGVVGDGGLWLCALVAALLSQAGLGGAVRTASQAPAARRSGRRHGPQALTQRLRAALGPPLLRLRWAWASYALGVGAGVLVLLADRVRWEDLLWPSWWICLACAVRVVWARPLTRPGLVLAHGVLGLAAGLATRLPPPAALGDAVQGLRWGVGTALGTLLLLGALSLAAACLARHAAGPLILRVIGSWCCAASCIALALWARAGGIVW